MQASKGWRYEKTGGNHFRVFNPLGQPVSTVAGTPSDHRAIKNARAQLKRAGLPLKEILMAQPSGPARPLNLDRSRFAAAIKRERKERGWTQDDLGAAIGNSGALVGIWEKERGGPSNDSLGRLMTVCGWTDYYGTKAQAPSKPAPKAEEPTALAEPTNVRGPLKIRSLRDLPRDALEHFTDRMTVQNARLIELGAQWAAVPSAANRDAFMAEVKRILEEGEIVDRVLGG